MAKSLFGKTKAEVAFNMTPMIDVTFQLIIFFMLVTQIVSSEYVQMDLPKPHENLAEKLEEKTKVIVNVRPYGPRAKKRHDGLSLGYSIGTKKIKKGDVQGLSALLKRARQQAVARGGNEAEKQQIHDDFAVEIRADRTMHYQEVLPVLEAVQDAEIVKMRITALKGRDRGATP